MNYQIVFDENDIRDIKIILKNKDDSEIVEMLFITPLIAGKLIEDNYEETEECITLHTLLGKGEEALHQMGLNAYSVRKCLEDSINKNEDVMKSLERIHEYMDEVREKSYKEIFDLLDE